MSSLLQLASVSACSGHGSQLAADARIQTHSRGCSFATGAHNQRGVLQAGLMLLASGDHVLTLELEPAQPSSCR